MTKQYVSKCCGAEILHAVMAQFNKRGDLIGFKDTKEKECSKCHKPCEVVAKEE